MSRHREAQEIAIPSPFAIYEDDWSNTVNILVQRPDFAAIAHSDYDVGEILKEVAEAFGEISSGKSRRNNEPYKQLSYYLEDLFRNTMIDPSYDDFQQSEYPMTETQKAVIVQWIFKDKDQLVEIIRNRNAAWLIVAQCSRFKKLPHEIMDPHNHYCGLYHIYFNRAMTEYYIYVEQEREPLDGSSDEDEIASFAKMGIKVVDNRTKENLEDIGRSGGLPNTAKVIASMVENDEEHTS